MKARFVWYYDTLRPGLAAFPLALEEVVAERMEAMVDEIREYMQANAPWEDDTGDAREGLDAEFTEEGSENVIYLFHTVDYGIWLEVRWSGAYAIIQPTVEVMGPAVMAALSGSVEDAT